MHKAERRKVAFPPKVLTKIWCFAQLLKSRGEASDDARMMSILFIYEQCGKLGFLQEMRKSEDTFFFFFFFPASVSLFFPVSGIFLPTVKLQIIVNLFSIPPPSFYFILEIGHCFTYHFYKAAFLFFFGICHK